MGWQKINTVITADTGGDEDEKTEGFLKGTGHEDGFYCFYRAPFHRYKPFIAQTYLPKLEVQELSKELEIQDYSFNNDRVFATSEEASAQVVFKSAFEGEWIYPQGTTTPGADVGLREPYYHTDLDGETLIGDYYYKGSLPQEINGEPYVWTLEGAIPSWTSLGQYIHVKLTQDFWEWYDNGTISQQRSGFCGRYYNERNGTWKFVGIPTFITETSVAGSYFFNETFKRGNKDDHDQFVYDGDKGHTIQYKNGQWVVGRVGTGHWSARVSKYTLFHCL